MVPLFSFEITGLGYEGVRGTRRVDVEEVRIALSTDRIKIGVWGGSQWGRVRDPLNPPAVPACSRNLQLSPLLPPALSAANLEQV
jgi:hypothetical protein